MSKLNAGKLILMISLLSLAQASMANVYPDKAENARHFIQITKKELNYGFKLCLVADKLKCEQIGEKEFYTGLELSQKEQAIKDKTALSNVGALVTGGLSLLFSARLYLTRKTISKKNLERDITLKYEVDEKGTAIGSIYDYVEKLNRALATKIPVQP